MKSFTVGTDEEEKEDAGYHVAFTLEETCRIRDRIAAAAATAAAMAHRLCPARLRLGCQDRKSVV